MTTLFIEPRKNWLTQEHSHDFNKANRKPSEPTVCPICYAVFKGGRWQWLDSWPLEARKETCQACRQIKDNRPAGTVTLSGDFVQTHRQEVINLIRHQERNERSLHPLHRIIKLEERPDQMIVTTTDIHLPKRIGQAIHRAYKGDLKLRYDPDHCLVRADWMSPASPVRKSMPTKRRKP